MACAMQPIPIITKFRFGPVLHEDRILRPNSRDGD